MLLHFEASFRSTTRLGEGRSLVDVRIPEVDVRLVGGRDVVARTPHPNKHLMIPTARGRKAQRGILVDVGDAPDEMTIVARWAVDAEAVLVHENAIQHEGPRRDVIATSAWLWKCWGHKDWIWDDDAWPTGVRRDVGSIEIDAVMDEVPGVLGVERRDDDHVVGGRVVRRRETMAVTSIGRNRYDYVANRRLHPPMPVKAVNG